MTELQKMLADAQAKAKHFDKRWFVVQEPDGSRRVTPTVPPPEKMYAECFPGGRIVLWLCQG